MGYCIELEESTISITRDNVIKIMETIKDYVTKENPEWRWVSNKCLLECIDDNDFEGMMDEIRYAVALQDDLYVIDYLSGEKLGNDFDIFKLIAPFINEGYIEMLGEDGDKWRWIFKDGNCEEVYPKVEWQ